MEVTEEMLQIAITKAVELKLIPKFDDMEKHLYYWDTMKKILMAALGGNHDR